MRRDAIESLIYVFLTDKNSLLWGVIIRLLMHTTNLLVVGLEIKNKNFNDTSKKVKKYLRSDFVRYTLNCSHAQQLLSDPVDQL